MHEGMKLLDVVENSRYGELLCRIDLTHISALEFARVRCREASPFLTGALSTSILHGRREGLLAQRGEHDGSTHP